MRTLLPLLILAVLAGCAGCKSDKPTAAATGGATPATGGGGTAAKPARPPAPFDQAAFETISKLDFGGAPTTVLELTNDSLALRIAPYAEPAQATMATVRASRCLNCVPMEQAAWEARLPELKQLMPKEVRDLPETIFELGEVTVSGTKAIFAHQVAVLAVGGTNGQPLQRAMNTHAYTLYWNDGVNQIQISVKDAAPPDAPTVEQLAARIPRATLETLATSTFATLLPYLPGK